MIVKLTALFVLVLVELHDDFNITLFDSVESLFSCYLSYW